MHISEDFKLTNASSLLLDLFRGLASQAVVIGHGLSFFGISNKFDYIQNSAVVIFFILSGFVISYSTFGKISGNREYGFFSYFIDRFSRIHTGFISALFMVLCIDLLARSSFGNAYGYSDALNTRTFLGNIFMLQDYPVFFDSRVLWVIVNVFSSDFLYELFFVFQVTSFGSARPFWTIAVEWWIYMLFGWIVLGKAYRENPPLVFWAVLIVLLIVPTFNLVNGRGQGLTMFWFMGFLVYTIISRFSFKASQRVHSLLIGFFFACAITRVLYLEDAYDSVYAGLLALMLFFFISYFQKNVMVLPKAIITLIKFNADISYSLYLIHYTLLNVIFLWRGSGGISNLLIGLAVSNFVAIAMYFILDRHHKTIRIWLKRSLKIG